MDNLIIIINSVLIKRIHAVEQSSSCILYSYINTILGLVSWVIAVLSGRFAISTETVVASTSPYNDTTIVKDRHLLASS